MLTPQWSANHEYALVAKEKATALIGQWSGVSAGRPVGGSVSGVTVESAVMTRIWPQ